MKFNYVFFAIFKGQEGNNSSKAHICIVVATRFGVPIFFTISIRFPEKMIDYSQNKLLPMFISFKASKILWHFIQNHRLMDYLSTHKLVILKKVFKVNFQPLYLLRSVIQGACHNSHNKKNCWRSNKPHRNLSSLNFLVCHWLYVVSELSISRPSLRFSSVIQVINLLKWRPFAAAEAMVNIWLIVQLGQLFEFDKKISLFVDNSIRHFMVVIFT